jgi:FkbM family methyltransferase
MGLRHYTYEWNSTSLARAMHRAGLVSCGGHVICTPFLGRDSQVVDLGANRGDFYLSLSKRTACRYCAVEAAPDLYRQLPTVPGLRKFNIAVHSRDERLFLALSNNPQANSIQKGIAGRYGYRGEVEVEGWTLEHVLAEAQLATVDLLKVDIEGAEIGMFNSTSDATLGKISQIAVEFHDFLNPADLPQVKAIVRRVRDLGFLVLVFSSGDWREVLMLNAKRLPLNGSQKVWIRISLLLIVMRRGRFKLSRLLRRVSAGN